MKAAWNERNRRNGRDRRVLKTVTLAKIYEEARVNPKLTFDEWRITEVRLKCLKAMENMVAYDYLADWAEKHIQELFAAGIVIDEAGDLAVKMLEWYVSNTQGKVATRAMEFSLSLTEKKGKEAFIFIERPVSKIITGRLLRGEEVNFYPALTSLPKFLGMLLTKLDPSYRSDDRIYQYSESDWFCAERALRVIVREKDFSFLPKIEELIVLLQEGKIWPFNKPFYAKASHLAILKEARRILLKAKKESLCGRLD